MNVNLNFSFTFDLSDKSRERSSPSKNSAEFASFFQKINRGGEIQNRKISSISLAPIHVSHSRNYAVAARKQRKNKECPSNVLSTIVQRLISLGHIFRHDDKNEVKSEKCTLGKVFRFRIFRILFSLLNIYDKIWNSFYNYIRL